MGRVILHVLAEVGRPIVNGDRIIAAFPFRDYVIAITERGKILKIVVNED